jgi:hypothetical protein
MSSSTQQSVVSNQPKAAEVYAGSNGEVTRAYYAELERRGPLGMVAMNLFRAQKCSARAKVYRGRGFKRDAYDRKNWSLGLLCTYLLSVERIIEFCDAVSERPAEVEA